MVVKNWDFCENHIRTYTQMYCFIVKIEHLSTFYWVEGSRVLRKPKVPATASQIRNLKWWRGRGGMGRQYLGGCIEGGMPYSYTPRGSPVTLNKGKLQSHLGGVSPRLPFPEFFKHFDQKSLDIWQKQKKILWKKGRTSVF